MPVIRLGVTTASYKLVHLYETKGAESKVVYSPTAKLTFA